MAINYIDPENSGLPSLEAFGMLHPERAITLDSYVASLDQLLSDEEIIKSRISLIKKNKMGPMNLSQSFLDHPPNIFNYANISVVPEKSLSEIMPKPGLPFETIERWAQVNLAPIILINTRVDDILRYSQYSDQSWKPGWRIVLENEALAPSDQEKEEIELAKRFIHHSNIYTTNGDSITMYEKNLLYFPEFLARITRDSLTYDGISIWTQRNENNMIEAYAPFPTSMIRLVRDGVFEGEEDVVAVACNPTGEVVNTFKRNQFIWYVRNPQNSPNAFNYGMSEIEYGSRLIDSFQQAFQLNASTFTANATPYGMLVLKGLVGANRNLTDILAREWMNAKRGLSKGWALPLVSLPKEAEIEVLDMSGIKGSEARYQDHMNMSFSLFCALYRMPASRFGFRASGNGPVPKSLDPKEDSLDTEDTGRIVLLGHLQTLIDKYIIKANWPNLKFQFCGISPKEDAREFQTRENAKTWGERRKSVDMPPLASLEISEELKPLAEILDLMPVDPGLTGAFQSLASIYLGGKLNAKKENATFHSPRDPAEAIEHGAPPRNPQNRRLR